MKKQITLVLSMAFAAASAMVSLPAHADDLAKTGRDILAKSQGAVVTVKLAIKQSVSMGGRENKSESKTETTGTVVDSSGLTVVSLATTDPSSTVKDAY